jgi:ribA/ribD-fused uncharacterized protein
MQLPTKQSRATFSKIAMPYAMKLLDQELTTFANAGFRIVTASSISRLRESEWPWPAMDVEFKAGDRGVDEGVAVNPEEKAAAELAAEEAAAEAKPKRKKGSATGSAGPTEATDAAVVVDAMAIQFGTKLENQYFGFSTFAPVAFRVTGSQVPGVDGTVYPEIGVGANGSIDVAKQTWPTVEHYYQAMKFPLDAAWQEAIRQAVSPLKAKQMGADPAHPARGDWGQVKDRVMKAALLAKFQQNLPLLGLLQRTGDRKLLEVSPGDPYWSAGPKGKGQNRLGTMLAEIRGELKDVRVDQALMAPAAPAPAAANPLQDAVADATGGVVRLATVPEVTEGSESAPAPVVGTQGGGVYLFINSAAGPSERRGRERGSGRKLAWDGMAVSKMDSSTEPQSGGNDVEEMTTDSGASLEVSVEKLGQ